MHRLALVLLSCCVAICAEAQTITQAAPTSDGQKITRAVNFGISSAASVKGGHTMPPSPSAVGVSGPIAAAATGPSVTSVSPASGLSGSSITITGSGFGSTQGTSSVALVGITTNGTAQITSWSDSSIVAIVPSLPPLPSARYTLQVKVAGAIGTSPFFLANPAIYGSLLPSRASTGSVVTINGFNFGSSQGSSTVTVSGTVAQVTSWSAGFINFVVPSNQALGVHNVQVTVGGVGSNTASLMVSTSPFISYFGPPLTQESNSLDINAAPVGQEITINGANFGSSQGSSTVTFNGVNAIPTSWSSQAITVPVPAGSTTGNVVVTVNAKASNGVQFMVSPPVADGGVGFVQGGYSNIPICDGANAAMVINFPADELAGDLDVAAVSWRDTIPNSITSTTNLFVAKTFLQSSTVNTSGYGQTAITYEPNMPGGPTTFTWGWNWCPTSPEVRIVEYKGVSQSSTGNPATDFDGAPLLQASSGTTADSGFETTSNQNDVLIGVGMAGNSLSITAPGVNYTSRVITPGGNIHEDRIVTSTGSYDATASMSASGKWVMGMLAAKELPNQAPVVDAGPEQTINLPTNTATLGGTVTDDGLPNNTLTISWTQVSGPGTVTFSSPSTALTNVTFPVAGTYVLQLAASDSQLSASSNVTVTVNGNNPVIVNAGPNQTITLPQNAVTLSGSVTGNKVLSTAWSFTSGPAPAQFGNTGSLTTTAVFAQSGVYVLTLTAFTGSYSASSTVTITVNQLSGVPNSPSLVLTPTSAGPVTVGGSQSIQATLQDASGNPVANAAVTFTVSGANVAVSQLTTNASGIATFSYKGSHAGVDTVIATSTFGPLNVASNPSMISWVTSAGGTAGVTLSPQGVSPPLGLGGLVGAFTDSNGAVILAVSIGATPKTFVVPTGATQFQLGVDDDKFSDNAGSYTVKVNGTTVTVPPTAMPWNWVSGGLNTNFQYGIRDGSAPLIVLTQLASGEGVSVAYQSGTVSVATCCFPFTNADGDTADITDGLTGSTGTFFPTQYMKSLVYMVGQTAKFTAFVIDSAGSPSANVPVVLNVTGANAQQLTGSTDVTGTVVFSYKGVFAGVDTVQAQASPSSTTTYISNQSTVTWTAFTNPPPVGTITISPPSPPSTPVGQSQTFTVQASDSSGNPVANLPVTLLISPVNTQQLTGTTDSSGSVMFSYVGNNAGTDYVQAQAIISSQVQFTKAVPLTWTSSGGGNGGGSCGCVAQGWIGSPTVGSVVKSQVSIMVASGITLTSGTLTFWPTSNPSAVTTLNSNTTGSGTIGMFDATTLASGGYTIQLNASANGMTQVSQITVSVVGNNKPGRMTSTVTEFKVPLAGIPISITRTYDSLDRSRIEDFGFGWRLGTFIDLSVDSHNNVTFNFNGQKITFFFTPVPQSFFGIWLVPAYTPQAGVHGSLISNGCDGLLNLQGSLVCFPSTGQTYQPTLYQYTDPIGRSYTITSSGQLQSIQDLNGNSLTVTPTGITSNVSGVEVAFVRDGSGRITKITDLNGKNYTYTYDTSGNLQSV